MSLEHARLTARQEDRRPSWQTADLLYGLAILAFLFALQRIEPFPDDPWMSQFSRLMLVLISLLSLVRFSLHACRKRACWPLFERTSLRSLAMEFLVSSWYMFLILLVCGLILFIPALTLKPGMSKPEALGGTVAAPDSILTMMLLVVVITLGPVAEELFFRGFLYNALKSRMSVAWAAVLQAIVFSAFHRYDLFNSLRVFLFGIAFAIIYEKRRSIVSPISAHVFVNAIATLPLLFTTALYIRH